MCMLLLLGHSVHLDICTIGSSEKSCWDLRLVMQFWGLEALWIQSMAEREQQCQFAPPALTLARSTQLLSLSVSVSLCLSVCLSLSLSLSLLSLCLSLSLCLCLCLSLSLSSLPPPPLLSPSPPSLSLLSLPPPLSLLLTPSTPYHCSLSSRFQSPECLQ